MREEQMAAFKLYFEKTDPELYRFIGSNLAFIPDQKGNVGVANMMGAQHYTEEQAAKFKKIVLDFEKQ